MDAADLTEEGGIFTITDVTVTQGDQPVNVSLAEFPRPWRPAKTVRRILARVWGPDSQTWVGKRAHLYNDPSVRWAGEAVGGVRVRAVSGIDKPVNVTLPTSRGKYGKYTIQPLPDVPAAAPQTDWQARLQQVQGDPDAARSLYTEAQQAGAPDDYLAAVQAAGQPQGEQ
jgi:hypothetical protein